MTDREQIEDFVIKAQIEAITGIRKSHGEKTALIMTRGMLAAACFMLKMMAGSKVAAMELYVIADRYACE